MQEEIRKLTNEFVGNLVRVLTSGKVEDLGAVHRGVVGALTGKKRGLGALPFEQRSIIAKKAAATRKRRAAGRKAATTRSQRKP